METRANHVWVGTIALLLLAAVAAAIIWIARISDGRQNEYDIFFKQSVSGLAKGSGVAFSGVPVGQVKTIELWQKDPSFVRVRIALDPKVPILQGTTATIQGSFTGVSDIQLAGAVKGAPPIVEPGPEGVPVIPTKRGGLGEILNSAPVLLERLATLTDRLTLVLSDENQKSLTAILHNTDRMSSSLADTTPDVKRTLAELQLTLNQATRTLAGFEQVAGSANSLLGDQGDTLARDMRKTLQSAKTAADQLQATLGSAQPAIDRMSGTTLPAAEAAIRDLRATSKALRNVTEKIDEQGAGGIVSGNNLPDYKP